MYFIEFFTLIIMVDYVNNLGLRLVNFKSYQMAVALNSDQVAAALKSSLVGAVLMSNQVGANLIWLRKSLFLNLSFLSSRARLKLFLIQCPFCMPVQVE